MGVAIRRLFGIKQNKTHVLVYEFAEESDYLFVFAVIVLSGVGVGGGGGGSGGGGVFVVIDMGGGDGRGGGGGGGGDGGDDGGVFVVALFLSCRHLKRCCC